MATELIKIGLNEANFIYFHIHFIIIIIGLVIAAILLRSKIRFPWRINQIELNIPFNSGTITVKPKYEVVRIAHIAWTELLTRKVGIPFDDDHDVIVEVYDSWYQLFEVFRTLAKSVPAEDVKDSDDTRKMIQILMTVLNKGLRPHLTQWQARFRQWYLCKQQESPDKEPQEIQKDYPKYNELVASLKEVNTMMVRLAHDLNKIAHKGTDFGSA